VFALTTFLCAACSTVRLTPSASKYLKDGKTAADAQKDLDKAQRALMLERTRVDRVIRTFELLAETYPAIQRKLAAALGTTSSEPGELEPEQLTIDDFVQSVRLMEAQLKLQNQDVGAREKSVNIARRQELAQVIIEHWWVGAFTLPNAADTAAVDQAFRIALDGKQRPNEDDENPETTPLVASDARGEFLVDEVALRQRDVNQLQVVESGRWEYFVDGSVYFSIEPLIAIRPDLEAIAVPSLAINWRPFNAASFTDTWAGDLTEWSALGFQLAFGGALNPSGGSEENTSGALGVGMSVPVADVGAFSFGAVWFSDDDDSHSAPYVSLTLGDFGKSTQGARD